jgi:hypothetical protein
LIQGITDLLSGLIIYAGPNVDALNATAKGVLRRWRDLQARHDSLLFLLFNKLAHSQRSLKALLDTRSGD